ncbi:MAG: SPFH domain-containing protein [Planctomycetes bacterium]|nr:SPFH domain-containing protein [Planctomycetota bacterium]
MQEQERKVLSGWLMLPVVIAVWLAAIALIYSGIRYQRVWWIAGGALTVPLALLLSKGLFTLQPNEARVLVLFGKYVGTVRQDGFHWANPFAVNRGPWVTVRQPEKQGAQLESQHKYRVSLRARNFETQAVKVNDQRGNPIEIGAVVVWRVEDTAKALFDVDEYENYVKVQSETAVRHLANSYPYDHSGDSPEGELTLRGNSNDISEALEKELHERLSRAGVVVQEARLTHLAYAPEIAGAMLRRQAAEAIIAARQKIVHGAVSMVQMALTELSEKHVVDLDEERKAAMVSNLLVVLCGEQAAEPVINTGTLYH